MKKVFKSVVVVAVLVAATVSASAQVSINAGYVSSTATDNGKTTDPVSGIAAGIGYDMNIQGGVGLAWGLNYTYAWDKVSQELPIVGTITAKSTDHYLDVPVRLTYTLPLSGDLSVFGFAGPKFVYALAGNTKIGDGDPIDHYKDLDLGALGKVENDLSRFDIKAGLGAGVQFKNISVKAGYDWGLLNQYEGKTAEKNTLKSNNFYVGLGFAF